MFSKTPKRNPHHVLLVEFNPYQILVAEVRRPHRGPVILESSAQFEREDLAGLRAWIDAKDNGRKGWVTAICGIVPLRGIVQRESVLPARLTEPGYLEEIIQEQQKGRYLTATPFKIFKEGAWTFRTVNALDGTALPATDHPAPALISALASDDVIETQQQLFDHRVLRERVEPGILPLFGSVYEIVASRGSTRAVVVIVIHESVTAVYILGKEGVHTPNPVAHGLHSIVELARKELGAKNDQEVLAELQEGNPLLVGQAAKLVRRIGRDLKPVVDSFEMTTGQPVDEILCAYLPGNLSWLAEPLARSTARAPFAVDCNEWLKGARLEVGPEGPTFGPQWLGALSLVAHLPETSALKSEAGLRSKRSYERPWHVDCSIATELDERKIVTRRFLAGAFAAVLALCAVTVTGWQLYANNSLRADTLFWEKQMAGNRRLFDELAAANSALKTQSAVLGHAYDLMAEPFQLSDLLLLLGRTIPPRMRVEGIDSNDVRVAISGTLLEPAEEASGTLGRYIDDLKRHPTLAPLFSTIAITTLQRKLGGEGMIFELTLRLKPPSP